MAKKETQETKDLKERLFMQKKNAYLRMSDAEIKKMNKFCENYKQFLDVAKTEREATTFIRKAAEEHGFVPFNKNNTYKTGDKVYLVNREKSVILAIIGKEPIENGVNLVAKRISTHRALI